MHTDAIIQHLASMCEVPTEINVLSTEEIQEGVIFAVFTFAPDEEPTAAIYYPETDMLFTPHDWQEPGPTCAGEIDRYRWMDSAGDEAIVANGLPMAFSALRDTARKEFGKRVAAARRSLDLSQAELGQRSGLKQTNIARIESGRYGVSLDTITRLSAALGDLI